MFIKAVVFHPPTPSRQDATFTDQGRTLVPRCSYLVFRKRTTLHEIRFTRLKIDAKTKLEDFFNILPNWAFHFLTFPGSLMQPWP